MNDSSLGRIVAVLYQPSAAFASIARRPTWLVALAVLVAVSLGAAFVWIPKIDMAEVMRSQMEASGQSLGEEEIENFVGVFQRLKWPMFLGSIVFIQPLGYLLMALLFFLIFKVAGSEMSYKGSFATVVHGFLPAGVAAILTIPIVLGREEIDFQQFQSGGFLTSNLAFLAPEPGSPLASLLGSLDFFSIWTVVLLAIGYSAVAGVRRQTAALAVVVPWLLWVLAKAGLAALS